ncbi:MAG: DNA gyrase inhibitor YacG [Candidatus Acidiferrales bacterium]
MKFHCPICGKPADSETDRDFPFCSERCRLIDLGNWASGKYRVAVTHMDESETEDGGTREPNPSHDEQ